MLVRSESIALGLFILLAAVSGANADYVAYSVSDKGRSPLPENVDGIEVEHMLNIEWGDYGGPRSRLGVLEVDNHSSATSVKIAGIVDYSSGFQTVPVDGIEAILMDCLNRTGRFRLVERTQLGSVLAEQDLAASGRVAAPSGAKTGNVLGAQYLVQLVVTDYEQDVKDSSKGIGGFLSREVPLIGGVGVESSTGRVGMNLRLIDAETSEIAFTEQIDVEVKESGLKFGGGTVIGDLGLGGFMDNFSKTPIGQAVIAGVNEAVFSLIKQVGSQAASGSVVQGNASQVIVNLGQDDVSVGDRLAVSRPGEPLIDPDTGLSLGSMDTELGEVEVIQVQEKFSVTRPVSLSQSAERGDVVKAMQPAAKLEFASSWAPPK